MPSYSMSLFLLPKAFCHSLDSAFRKFWWGFPAEKKHNLTLLSWDRICSPKALGGLGLRKMEFQNASLLAKLGWKVLSGANLLWVRALSSKYLRRNNFLSVQPSPTASWLWKGILNCRKVVQDGACLAVSTGLNVSIWNDPWVPSIQGFKPSPKADLPSLPNLTVSDLITYPVRNWNSPLINFLFDPESASQIHAIHISSVPVPDRWIWTASPSGLFSVKSAHEVASSQASFLVLLLSNSDWQLLWGLKLQARLKLFLWRLVWNILPIRPNIFRFALTLILTW
jgi:hypothetical protein